MKAINRIKVWLNKVLTCIRQNRIAHKAKTVKLESRHVLQAMEFGGELFLSYRGVPIIKEKLLTAKIPEALEASRDTYVEFVTSKEV
jgi:hypothetical protein